MKKILFGLPWLAALLAGCSNDFDLTAPWKEVPVAFAILSPRDSAYYIRVEKAFLDPETSALAIAQIADSLYYPENTIAVYLQRVSNGTRYQLQRVDGNKEGYVREGGVFATTPNWLYKYKPVGATDSLKAGETYRFVLERKDGKPNVTAETTIPKNFTLSLPDPTFDPRIGFVDSTITTITWRTDANGVYFNVSMVLRYREEAANGTVLGRTTLVWPMAKNLERTNTLIGSTGLYKGELMLSSDEFYNFLLANIQPATDRFRYFEFCDLIIEGGGKEIKEYIETAVANSGLTGAEVVSSYTNLSEGFGIVSSKNKTVSTGIRISEQTVNSMKKKASTKGLNFTF